MPVPQSRDPGHQWTAVRLQEGSDRCLQRVYAAVPRLIKSVDNATLDAWIDWGPANEEGGLLQVHIGDYRVGLLDEDATATYRDVMNAAAQRAELPCVEARLTPIAVEASYLLEVALPAPSTRAQRGDGLVTHPRPSQTDAPAATERAERACLTRRNEIMVA